MAHVADCRDMTNLANPSTDPVLDSIVDALIVLHDSPLALDIRLSGALQDAFERRLRTAPSGDAIAAAPAWAQSFDVLAVVTVYGSHWHHMPLDDWAAVTEAL